jgi:hypothetical protein
MVPTAFTQAQLSNSPPQFTSNTPESTPNFVAPSAGLPSLPIPGSTASQSLSGTVSPQVMANFTQGLSARPQSPGLLDATDLSQRRTSLLAPGSSMSSTPGSLSQPAYTRPQLSGGSLTQAAPFSPAQRTLASRPLSLPTTSQYPVSGLQTSSMPVAMQSATMGSPRLMADDQALVDQYRAEMGDKDQLLAFFSRYKDHSRYSKKCALDGRYFWKVLAPYDGLVQSELYLRINQGDLVDDEEDGPVRDFESKVFFDTDELAATKGAPVRYRLIKAIMDISDDAASNTGSVHSNLIYIDTKTKEIVRFEPMFDDYYTEPINTMLEEYFKGILPEYSYRMLDEHPQLPTTDSCPSKGMCAAYVLKKAMMVVTGNDRPLNGDPMEEEIKILKFGDAIETEYGVLPDPELMEAGFTVGFTSGPTYAQPVYVSPQPYASPIVAAPYGPSYIDPFGPVVTPAIAPGLTMYSPQYYGYVWGPRFARRPGWGWGARRWRHFGAWSQEWGRWDEAKGKVAGAYQKAKEKAGSGWEKVKGKVSEKERKKQAVKKGLEKAEWKDTSQEESSDWRSYDSSIDSSEEMPSSPQSRGKAGKVLGASEEEMAAPGKAQKLLGLHAGEYGSYHRGEHGCGCGGCRYAPPKGSYGYWEHDPNGRSWKTVSYLGNHPTVVEQSQSAPAGFAAKPEEGGGEFGCGCGKTVKTPASVLTPQATQLLPPGQSNSIRVEGSWNPKTWTPMQQTLGGAAVGGIAGGLLTGGLGGAAVGAVAGGAGGYLLGRSARESHGSPSYSRFPDEGGEHGLDPRTWSPGQQTVGGAAAGALIGGPLLGMGWKGALLGAAGGAAGGYLLGKAERGSRRRYYYGPPPGHFQVPSGHAQSHPHRTIYQQPYYSQQPVYSQQPYYGQQPYYSQQPVYSQQPYGYGY